MKYLNIVFFLHRCKALFTGQKIGGGELMENAVNAVFSALIWHTQELREAVTAFGNQSINPLMLECF